MHNFLTEVTADCTDVLVVKPQKVMPNPGRKNQIVHTFEDGRNAVVAVSNTSIFEVELQWTYVSEEDRSTIFELFHASAKANGSARSFYWYNPIDGYVYTVRFLTPLRTVYKPGSLRSIETVRLRVDGIFADTEYIIDLGDLHLATVDNGAMFFHDTEDFSVYAGASGNTPFRIVFTDSGGLTAEAWCGEVGGGLDHGGELVTNGDFSDFTGTIDDGVEDTFADWDLAETSGDAEWYATSDNTNSIKYVCAVAPDYPWEHVLRQAFSILSGNIFRATINAKGTALLSFSSNWNDNLGGFKKNIDLTGSFVETSAIFTADLDTKGAYVRTNRPLALGVEAIITEISFKQLTDIPATGLKLYSTPNGSTQSMGTTDAGFNPNAITKVDIYG